MASARLRQGGAAVRQGQTTKAVAFFEEARTIYAAAGDKAGVVAQIARLVPEYRQPDADLARTAVS